jgi:hypothetical protein
MSTRPLKITELERWVGQNSLPPRSLYAKGRWDYVEVLRKLSAKLGIEDVRVVGHYVVETPPPEELLPMPVVALAGHGTTVALKWDFGAAARWPREWTLSVRRSSPYRGPLFGLFDATLDLRGARLDGLAPAWVFGAYCDDQAQFSCELEDEWDVMMLLRMIFYEV